MVLGLLGKETFMKRNSQLIQKPALEEDAMERALMWDSWGWYKKWTTNYHEISWGVVGNSSEGEGMCYVFSYLAISPFLGKWRPCCFQGRLIHCSATMERSGIKTGECKWRSLFSDIESTPEYTPVTCQSFYVHANSWERSWCLYSLSERDHLYFVKLECLTGIFISRWCHAFLSGFMVERFYLNPCNWILGNEWESKVWL